METKQFGSCNLIQKWLLDIKEKENKKEAEKFEKVVKKWKEN